MPWQEIMWVQYRRALDFFQENPETQCFRWFLLLFSLWIRRHGLQHTRLLCPPLSPGVCSNSCPLSWWCYLTISSSAARSPSTGFQMWAVNSNYSWNTVLGKQNTYVGCVGPTCCQSANSLLSGSVWLTGCSWSLEWGVTVGADTRSPRQMGSVTGADILGEGWRVSSLRGRTQTRGKEMLSGTHGGFLGPSGRSWKLPVTGLGWLYLLVVLGLELRVPVSLQPWYHRART